MTWDVSVVISREYDQAKKITELTQWPFFKGKMLMAKIVNN